MVVQVDYEVSDDGHAAGEDNLEDFEGLRSCLSCVHVRSESDVKLRRCY